MPVESNGLITLILWILNIATMYLFIIWDFVETDSSSLTPRYLIFNILLTLSPTTLMDLAAYC